MSDSEIIGAIRAAMWETFTDVDGYSSAELQGASSILDRLRAAGYDIARADTVRLGEAVQTAYPFTDVGEYGWVAVLMPDGRLHASRTAQVLLDMLHERAGVGRGAPPPPSTPVETGPDGERITTLAGERGYWRTNPHCLEHWPDHDGSEYHPSCCRFPKSCSSQDWVPLDRSEP